MLLPLNSAVFWVRRCRGLGAPRSCGGATRDLRGWLVLTRRGRALQARMKAMVDEIVTAVAAVERASGVASAADRGSGTRLTGVGVRLV